MDLMGQREFGAEAVGIAIERTLSVGVDNAVTVADTSKQLARNSKVKASETEAFVCFIRRITFETQRILMQPVAYCYPSRNDPIDADN